jgi:alpha-mannosidase
MHTIHLVTHTHWDREWYLTFQQFRLKLVHLVDDLLDILDKDPAFTSFLLDGQTIVLDDYLLMRPDRRGDLEKYIQAGRIIIGPWHILPDEFLVSPEATIRNLLQARRTGQQFGPLMPVGYVPDPFGHIGQMPQILNGFGITSACVQRGLGDEPCEFWWRAPDGSQVFMAYLRDGYSNAAELPDDNPLLFTSEMRRMRDSLIPFAASGHILLMWGTDHKEASPGASRMVAAAQGQLDGDRLVHSSLPAYIEAARADLEGRRPQPGIPFVTGELRSSKRHALLPNVLSTRMWIKQRNRACENLLEKWAEPFSVWASLACGDNIPPGTLRQPASILRQTWRLLIDNHPHDSICGCSIDQVHDEMRPRFDQVEQIAERITCQSLDALAGVINTVGPFAPDEPGELSPIVVFNPTAHSRTDFVSLTFDAPGGTGGFDLLDENGASLPYETSGLGSRDMVNMTLQPAEFARAMSMVSEGRVAGMTLQEFHIHREDSQVFIEIVLSDKSTPNLAAWFEGVEKIKASLADPTVTVYHIYARSAATTHLAFAVADVPGFGYRTFWARGKPGPQLAGKPPIHLNPITRALIPLAARLAFSPLAGRLLALLNPKPKSRPPYVIENEFLHVEAVHDGTLLLTDRRSGATYPGLNRFIDGGDGGDEYNYSPPVEDRLVTAKLKRVRVLHGKVRQTLELHLELVVPEKLADDRKSRSAKNVRIPLVTFASLTAGVARLDINTEVDNQAGDHRLRVHFPAPFAADQAGLATHDGHFEIVRRPIGLPVFDETWNEQPRPEVPQRAFTSLCDGKIGLAIANRGLPEVEALKRTAVRGQAEIALTLLRSVGWLSRDDLPGRKGPAGPAMETPGAQMIGKWVYDYSIIPFAGPESPAVYWQAYAFETPLRAVSAPAHAGGLPPNGSFLQVEPQEFVVSAVKITENEDAWLARGYNSSDKEIVVKLKAWKPFTRAERVNLAEEKIATLQPAGNGMVEFSARAHEIVTILFKFKDLSEK